MNKHGRDTVRDSLEGNVQQADIDLLKQYMEALKMHQAQKQTCLEEMVKSCKKHYDRAFSLLQSIPAVKEQSAAIIISEIGTNMSLFATAAALVSWAGLRQRGKKQQKCTVAIARHLLVIIWSLLSSDEYFDNEYIRKVRTGVA